VFQQILSDLNECASTSDNQVSKEIICHIVATMSDRAATEVKFNDMLYSYRKEILPLFYANYDTFSKAECESLETMSNFFCGLHALVNFADGTQTAIKEVENGYFDGKGPIFDQRFLKESEPGTCRLIRTASKAFGSGSGGDEKSGCQGSFKIFVKDFLREHNMNTVPIKPYRGSRFNVLFENAMTLYFLSDKMTDFLTSYGTSNQLLKAVLHDLTVTEYIAGVKALALVYKFVTCPLWHLLEDKSIYIFDMNQRYLQLTKFFEDASKNVNLFMTGKLLPFGDETYIVHDQYYSVVTKKSVYDHKVQIYLEVILSTLGKLTLHLFKDQLPGGKLHTLDAKTKEKLRGTPKTSTFAESVFGRLDQLLRSKPRINTLAAEAYIMFSNNKTSMWLEEKEIEQRDEILKEASKGVKTLQKKFRDRLDEITANRKRIMDNEIKKREDARKERIKKQEDYTRNILIHGLWQNESQIDNMLQSYKSSVQKAEALKAQLKFRKEVLLQKAENKTTYNITKMKPNSKSRTNLIVEELADNLKTLVKQAVVMDKISGTEKHLLVGKRIRHRFTTILNGVQKHEWYTGKVISQVYTTAFSVCCIRHSSVCQFVCP